MSGAGWSMPPTHAWNLRAVRHELRTPLNAVLGLSEALLSDGTGLTPGQRENLSTIATTARRLSDLFDDVLELSSEATERTHTCETIDPVALVEELSRELARSVGTRPIHVSVSTATPLPLIFGDRQRLPRLIASVGRYVLSLCAGELIELHADADAHGRVWIELRDPRRVLRAEEVSALLGDTPSRLRRRGLDESARLRLSMFRELAEREGGSFRCDADERGVCFGLGLPSTPLRASDRPLSIPVTRDTSDGTRGDRDVEQLRARFVTAMGHDLRGPLNTVLGFAELLTMEEHDAVSAADRPAVDHIRQSAQDLCTLIDNMLDWTRIESGQLVLARTRFSIDDALEETRAEAMSRAGARELQLRVDGADATLIVDADRGRVVQGLLGLLDHAIRTHGNPCATLRAEAAVGAGQLPTVRVTLHDPGLRIRQEDRAGFFEAFRASYEPSGRRVGGLGVGPAVGRALIRAHGGDVWFTSDPMDGTTFTIELPAP